MTQIDKKAFKIAKNVLLNCKTLCCYNEEALLSALESYESARAPRTITRGELAQALHAFLIALKDSALFHTDIALMELNNPMEKALATLGITVEG